jgi:hypothetical protein
LPLLLAAQKKGNLLHQRDQEEACLFKTGVQQEHIEWLQEILASRAPLMLCQPGSKGNGDVNVALPEERWMTPDLSSLEMEAIKDSEKLFVNEV